MKTRATACLKKCPGGPTATATSAAAAAIRCLCAIRPPARRKKVTDDYFEVGAVDSAFGRVVYTGTKFDAIMPVYNGLYALDTATGESRVLIEPGSYRIGQPKLMDEKTVLVTLKSKEAHLYAHGDLWLVDAETAKRPFLTEFDRSFGGGAINSDARMGGGQTLKLDGGKLYYTSSEDSDCFLHWIMKDGARSGSLTQPGSVDCFDVKDGKVVMVAMRGNCLPELYSLSENGEEKQLTHFNDWVVQDYAVSTPKPLNFTASDGFEIHGWVMEPVGYEPGKKYPAILHIHGGPRTAFGAVFHNEMQLWRRRDISFCSAIRTRDLVWHGFCRPFGQIRRRRLQKPDGVYRRVPQTIPGHRHGQRRRDGRQLRRLYDQLDHRPHRTASRPRPRSVQSPTGSPLRAQPTSAITST